MIAFDHLQVLEFLAKLTTGIITGSDSHLLLVEHPSMLACGTRAAVDHFNKMSVKLGAFQIIAKSVGILTSLGAFYYKRERKYLYSASLSFSMLFYSPIAFGSINTALHDPKIDKDSNETKTILLKWNKTHFMRTFVDFLAFSFLIF